MRVAYGPVQVMEVIGHVAFTDRHENTVVVLNIYDSGPDRWIEYATEGELKAAMLSERRAKTTTMKAPGFAMRHQPLHGVNPKDFPVFEL